jgi:hypothetical protein
VLRGKRLIATNKPFVASLDVLENLRKEESRLWITDPYRTLPARRVDDRQDPKGSKPVNLAVEPPKKFELAINLKAAKQIGTIRTASARAGA